MKKIIENYLPIVELEQSDAKPNGDSASPKEMIFHILEKNDGPVQVLDIGFGAGGLGQLIKSHPPAMHWCVDGIDGWQPNCHNQKLFDAKIYRNVWHGLAQDLPKEVLSEYKIICLLDVIEHLDAETAKWLIRTLLMNMGDDAFLFVSTPLWFYPQSEQQDGDLEAHLIGIPASSMMAMLPVMYAVNQPMIGGFIYGKKSLQYVEFFQPTSNPGFSHEMGFHILNAINPNFKYSTIYKCI